MDQDESEVATPDPSTELEVRPQQQLPRDKIYTVDEAINKMGFGPFQILITVFCGLIWLTDALEFMVLSVLSPAVKCQWDLTSFEEALITSLVFFGFLLGGVFWGVVSDAVGRKRGLLIVNVFVLIFGILSAIPVSSDDRRIPGYPWLLICRFGVGFGVSGAGQSVTYYVEFLPLKGRGICLVLIEIWWTIGTMFGAVLALAVLGGGGLDWHWFLGLAATPLALVLFAFPFIPESARFYLVKGKINKAQKVIERVAWYNCKKVPPGRVVSYEEKDSRCSVEDVVAYSEGTVTILDRSSQGVSYNVATAESDTELQNDHTNGANFDDETPLLVTDEVLNTSDSVAASASKKSRICSYSAILKVSPLFANGMWRTTVILMNLWLGAAWLYYGAILLTTSLLQYDPHCAHNSNVSNESTTCEDNQLQTSDYLKIIWTTAAELPGVIITLVIIELLGRKLTIAIEFIGCMIGFLLLFVCVSDSVLTIFLFIIRAFATGVFQAVYVYTPEVYSTNIRALGMGVCTSAARVGGIVTPYVAQVLLHASDYVTLSLYAGSSLVLAVLAMLLPIETKGRALHDKS